MGKCSVVVAVVLSTTSPAWAEDFYVSQVATGGGVSCSSAQSASWFNTASNWANPKQLEKIGPGDAVYLCGTITSNLTFRGRGTSGHPVVLDGTGAAMSANIYDGGQDYWIIQKVTWSDSFLGNPISVAGSHWLIQDCYAGNVTSTGSADNNAVWIYGGYLGFQPTDGILRNNFFRTTAAADTRQNDIISSGGSSNVTVEGNHLEMRVSDITNHDDPIQTFCGGGNCTNNPVSNWTIRYNRIVLNSISNSQKSFCMIEDMVGTNYVYGNLFFNPRGGIGGCQISSAGGATGGIFYIYNNTAILQGQNPWLWMSVPMSTYYIRNNICSTTGPVCMAYGRRSEEGVHTIRDHNLWAGGNIPTCVGHTGELCHTSETYPMFTDWANNEFSLQSLSPAKGVGVNLGSGPVGHAFDYGIAPRATWANPTLVKRSGAWDIGAYQYSEDSVAPAPPTVMRIVP